MNTEKILWDRVLKYSFLFRFVPFLKAVFVCNSLSFGNVKDGSDIDIFVIASKNRLFITRFFITIFLHFFRVRRHGNKISGRFCLSFFVDESHLNLKDIALQNDIYLSFWIKKLVLVFSENFSHEILLNNNLWIYDFVSKDISPLFFAKIKHKSFLIRFLENLFPNFFINFFEKFLKQRQINKARKSFSVLDKEKASIVISKNMLKFHNHDKRAFLNSLYVQKYGKQKIKNEEDFLSIFP